MCFGAEAGWVPALVGAAASTAGAYSQNRASNAATEKAVETDRAEKFRQAELQRQADAKVREGIAQFTPEQHNQQVQQATATREAALQPTAAAAPDTYSAGTVAAPVEVKSDLTRRLGDMLMKGQAQGAARARLGAYGDASMAEGFGMNRVAEGVRRTALESRNSSGLYPQELRRDVQGAGDDWRVGGDIANTIGQIGTYYATHRRPAPGGIGYGAASTPPPGPYPY